jgi:DNA-binding transcriptional regulator LsrR (DeoR family)
LADSNSEMVAELKSIKLLLIMQLLRSGVKQSQIAAMLGVSEATMSRMLPKGVSKSVSRKGASEEES